MSILISLSEEQRLSRIMSNLHTDTLLIYQKGYAGELPMDIPKIITDGSNVFKIVSLFNKNIVSIGYLTNLTMLETLKKFLDDHIFSRILLFKTKTMNIENHEIFESCFKNSLMNVVLIDENQEMITYSPLKRKVEIETVGNIFQSDNFKNFHGRRLNLGGNLLHYMTIFENSVVVWQRLTNLFLDKFNITLTLDEDFDADILISVHYTEDEMKSKILSKFCEFENSNIIIPLKTIKNKYLFFKYPFNWTVWLVICMGMAYKSIVLYISEKSFDKNCHLTSSMLSCLEILLWIGLKIRRSNWLLQTIYIILTIEGFILVNLYSMYLGSFLVVDLKRTRFEIGMVGTAEEINKEYVNVGKYNLKFMSIYEYGINLMTLNTQYGYSVPKTVWNSNAELQDHFRVVEYDIRRPFPLVPVINKNSMFENAINKFVILAYSHGMFQKWFREFIVLKPQKLTANTVTDMLVLKDFKYVIYIFDLGILFAILLFLAEVLYSKFFN